MTNIIIDAMQCNAIQYNAIQYNTSEVRRPRPPGARTSGGHSRRRGASWLKVALNYYTTIIYYATLPHYYFILVDYYTIILP